MNTHLQNRKQKRLHPLRWKVGNLKECQVAMQPLAITQHECGTPPTLLYGEDLTMDALRSGL